MARNEISVAGNGSCCSCPCSNCYCNCCSCYPETDLTFSMISCSIDSVTSSWTGRDCETCDGNAWEFTLSRDPNICYYHSSGAGGCTSCPDEYNQSVYPGPHRDYPEAWGFSGKICGECETDDPPMISDNCGGMCIRASLCCCKTGTYSEEWPPAEDRTCPVQSQNNCGTGPSGDYTCDMGCFWFQMSSYECYDIDGDGTNDSPCSPCAAVDNSFGPDIPVTLFTSEAGLCMNVVSGQCKNPNSDPEKKFMAVVKGTFQIACDCQTGEVLNYGTPGVSYQPVNMHFQGLITES